MLVGCTAAGEEVLCVAEFLTTISRLDGDAHTEESVVSGCVMNALEEEEEEEEEAVATCARGDIALFSGLDSVVVMGTFPSRGCSRCTWTTRR
jgi:hypothetical protein